MEINIGDKVVCYYQGNRVKGTVIEKYYPTSCEQQIMIITDDGRKFHAPARKWIRI